VELSKYIKEILISRDNVIVSGFGAFEKSFSSAKIDPVTNEMHPPQVTIIFRPELTVSSGVLDKYVSEKENITEDKAAELIQNQVAEWENSLQSGQNIVLHLLGTLSRDSNGQYHFEPSVEPSDFPESYGLPVIPVQEKSTTNDTIVKKTEEKKPIEKKQVEKKVPPQKKPIKTSQKPEITGTPKSHKKLVIGLIIGIPVAALIVLGALNFEFVKQKFNSTWNSLTSNTKNDKGNIAVVDSLKTDSSLISDNKDNNAKAILENYTIVNSETNTRIDPKVDPLKDLKKVYIIAGSYKIKTFATRQKNQLNKKGFKAEVLPLNNGLYRVSIASFKDMASVANDFERIKSIDENLNVWILVNK
jgi:nucleoid DNA-binding protein